MGSQPRLGAVLGPRHARGVAVLVPCAHRTLLRIRVVEHAPGLAVVRGAGGCTGYSMIQQLDGTDGTVASCRGR